MTAIGPGTKVKCIYPGPWHGQDVGGPPLGSVQTVVDVVSLNQRDYLWLVGWPELYAIRGFRPLDGSDERIAELRELLTKGDPDKVRAPEKAPA